MHANHTTMVRILTYKLLIWYSVSQARWHFPCNQEDDFTNAIITFNYMKATPPVQSRGWSFIMCQCMIQFLHLIPIFELGILSQMMIQNLLCINTWVVVTCSTYSQTVIKTHRSILQVSGYHTQILGLHVDPSSGANRKLLYSTLLLHTHTVATKYIQCTKGNCQICTKVITLHNDNNNKIIKRYTQIKHSM